MVNWHFMFMNKTVHEQVTTCLNYIPNKYVIIDDNLKKSLYNAKNFIELQNLAFDI